MKQILPLDSVTDDEHYEFCEIPKDEVNKGVIAFVYLGWIAFLILIFFLCVVSLACSIPVSSIPPTPTETATAQPVYIPATETSPTEYEYIPHPTKWYVCADEALNVRGAPDDNATILYQLQNGDVVRVREWSHNGNGWAMIQPANWVNGDYLCWSR